ncbi:MAG: DUF1573 domain-containing protein [Bacteroidales bacterium]|jgi:hypothetical protein|nr:DUF1573 domain-containing protein [Bacteroidales bacterium]
MKKVKKVLYFSLVVVLFLGSACNSKKNNAGKQVDVEEVPLKKTTIEFTEMEHNFGKVKEGEKVKYNFEFTNTGDADLLIQKVNTYCGCTVPKYTKKPISPGKKGTLEVVFDTKGRPGKQQKNISIATNTEPSTNILTLVGEVE